MLKSKVLRASCALIRIDYENEITGKRRQER